MTKIADIFTRSGSELLFICDFSPPRGHFYDDLTLEYAAALPADCLSVPYHPGKSVYANSAVAAHFLEAHTGKPAAFTISTRDMNILATQSLLIGAAMLGLQNVIVVRGDDFTPAELLHTKPVHDRTTTSLIRTISELNAGTDFRGRELIAPTDFRVGATVDPYRDLSAEVALTQRKIETGAHFLITQPGFAPQQAIAFLQSYSSTIGNNPPIPIFFGIQMIANGGRVFSPIPKSVHEALSQGVDSPTIAIRAIEALMQAGITSFYLMPPIFPGGARDYASALRVLQYFRSG